MECISMNTHIALFIYKHAPRISLCIVRALQATFKLVNLIGIEWHKGGKFQKPLYLLLGLTENIQGLAEIYKLRLG